ncbi:MAG TPA: transcriptional repressor LexA [Dehalococcoidales bacterium]|nr:transcriptional repressor LexA [Dehalococcoidales bacterium]
MRQIGHNDTRERILGFIHEFFDAHGYAPTVRDILKGCNLSSTAIVQHHLDVLERDGRIQRDPEVFRSIRLPDHKNLASVPLLGTIAAGKPIPVPSAETWTAQALDTIELPPEITGGKNVFALRVKGKSMIDALIDDGDIVLLNPVSSVNNGEMVAAWLKNEKQVTLKRFFAQSGKIILKPANQTMKPFVLEPDNVEIQGKVIGVIRKL